MFGLGLLTVIVLISFSYLVYYIVQGNKLQAYDVRVTNITASSATISWLTHQPTQGFVMYWSNGVRFAYDDRDVVLAQASCVEDLNNDALESGVDSIDCLNEYKVKNNKYYVHHVTVSGLEEGKIYNFVLSNGSLLWSSSKTNSYEYAFDTLSEFSVTTVIQDVVEMVVPNPMYGKIYGMKLDTGGLLYEDDSKDSMVFVGVVDESNVLISNLLSASTNSEGGWSIDKGAFRDLNGSVFDDINGMNGEVCYQYESFTPKQCYMITFGTDDIPVESILGNSEEDIDFENNAEDLLESFIPYVNAAWDEARCEDSEGKTVSYGPILAGGCAPTSPCYKTCLWNGVRQFNIRLQALCPKPAGCMERGRQMVEVDGEKKVIGEDQVVDAAGNLYTLLDGELVKNSVSGNVDVVDSSEYEDIIGDLQGSAEIMGFLEDKIELVVEGPEITGCSGYTTETVCNENYYGGCYWDKEKSECMGNNPGLPSPKPKESVDQEEEGKLRCSDYTTDYDLINCPSQDDYGTPCESFWFQCQPSVSNEEGEESSLSGNLSAEDFAPLVTNDSGEVIALECCHNVKKESSYVYIPNYYPTGIGQCEYETVDFYEYCADKVVKSVNLENEMYCFNKDEGNIINCDECGNKECVSASYFLRETITEDLVIANDVGSPTWNGDYIYLDDDGDYYYYSGPSVETPYATPTKQSLGDFNKDSFDDRWLLPLEEIEGLQYYCLTSKGDIEVQFNACGQKADLETIYGESFNTVIKTGGGTATFDTEYVKEGYVCCDSGFGVKQKQEVGKGCVAGYKIVPFGECSETSTLNLDNILQEIASFSAPKVSAQETEELFLSVTKDGYYEVIRPDSENVVQYYNADYKYIYYKDINNDGKFDVANGDYLVSSSVLELSVNQVSNAYDIVLKEGLNLVSFDFYPALNVGESYTAEQLLEEANSQFEVISQITYFSNGSWKGGIMSKSTESGTPAGSDFPLLPGFGYAIVATRNSRIPIPGFDINTNVPVSFIPGWNLIGVSGYTKAFTARTLIDSVNRISGLTADNITWWPVSKGMFEGLQVSEGTEYGFDYPITTSNGYFVRISSFQPEDSTCKSLIWHPDGELDGQCGNN